MESIINLLLWIGSLAIFIGLYVMFTNNGMEHTESAAIAFGVSVVFRIFFAFKNYGSKGGKWQ